MRNVVIFAIALGLFLVSGFLIVGANVQAQTPNECGLLMAGCALRCTECVEVCVFDENGDLICEDVCPTGTEIADCNEGCRDELDNCLANR